MSVHGKWCPVDLGGFRLYLVVLTFPAIPGGRGECSNELVSFGRSPTDAAERVRSLYVEAGHHSDIRAKGWPLNAFQPESWSNEDIPEPGDPRFGKWR